MEARHRLVPSPTLRLFRCTVRLDYRYPPTLFLLSIWFPLLLREGKQDAIFIVKMPLTIHYSPCRPHKRKTQMEHGIPKVCSIYFSRIGGGLRGICREPVLYRAVSEVLHCSPAAKAQPNLRKLRLDLFTSSE